MKAKDLFSYLLSIFDKYLECLLWAKLSLKIQSFI